MPSPVWFLIAASWPGLTASYAIYNTENATGVSRPLIAQRDDDPGITLDFVQRWAAIGDSFTAGIGSGSRMGTPAVNTHDWFCSRYTYTWPQIVDRSIGAGKKDFQYPACSGDRSEQIYEQAKNLEGELDVVMMTAGGNDLCLAAMIRQCVILPYDGEDACTTLINKAQENIDTILKDNIRQILDALKPKMKKNGIVIYNGYAPYFNTDNEDCADPKKQKWALPEFWSWKFWKWFRSPLPLTVDRRKRFNTLVNNINKAISDVVKEFQVDGAKKYDIEFADWSEWPAIVDGQMCSPSSDGSYPDPKQPEMLFFKSNTYVSRPDHELKRRELDPRLTDVDVVTVEDEPEESHHHDELWESRIRRTLKHLNLFDSLLYKSVNPRAAALHKLDPRTPAPPNCPGDNSFDPTLGLGLPDTFGMNFHPNGKGHEAIAAFALDALAYVRAVQLGKGAAVCSVQQDEFKCWRAAEGRKAYVTASRVVDNYKDFCDDVKPPKDTTNWRWDKTYNEKTPDEVQIVLQLSDDASGFDKKQCLESLDRIVNSCDGNDSKNPMNWKFGGRYKRGGYTYEINPKRDRALTTRPDSSCAGWYKVFFSSYSLYGTGWASWDYGQETLLKAARSCVGGGITSWQFGYYEKPEDHDGWEWWATFRTPIWVNARCFDNLKVQKGAGGYSHKWKDSHKDERYEDVGCTGSG